MLAIPSSVNVMRASFQEPTVARLRQAAARAQQVADDLQLQARDAWQEAERATTTARGLDSRATQAVADAGQAQDQFTTFTSRTQDVSAASAASSVTTPPAPTFTPNTDGTVTLPMSVWSPAPAPVGVNNLGQRVGTFLNITA